MAVAPRAHPARSAAGIGDQARDGTTGMTEKPEQDDFDLLLEMARDKTSAGRQALMAAVSDLFFDKNEILSDRERALMSDILRQIIHDVEMSVRRELASKLADAIERTPRPRHGAGQRRDRGRPPDPDQQRDPARHRPGRDHPAPHHAAPARHRHAPAPERERHRGAGRDRQPGRHQDDAGESQRAYLQDHHGVPGGAGEAHGYLPEPAAAPSRPRARARQADVLVGVGGAARAHRLPFRRRPDPARRDHREHGQGADEQRRRGQPAASSIPSRSSSRPSSRARARSPPT